MVISTNTGEQALCKILRKQTSLSAAELDEYRSRSKQLLDYTGAGRDHLEELLLGAPEAGVNIEGEDKSPPPALPG